jgi:transcriptional regulator with XRE-family HTH domain
MSKIKDLHKEWLRDPKYRAAYDALDEEFALATALVAARSQAGLRQQELAEKMDMSQSALARLGSGRTIPSGTTLKRFADATGTRLRITFEPVKAVKRA